MSREFLKIVCSELSMSLELSKPELSLSNELSMSTILLISPKPSISPPELSVSAELSNDVSES